MQVQTVAQGISIERAWRCREERDAAFDGRIFIAISTTRIYCKPSCPSPFAKREHVRFFASADAAEAAGYRACRRCRPRERDASAELVSLVAAYIESHLDQPLTLDELSAVAGVSPFHLQRKFKKATGVSPKAWARSARLRKFGRKLRTAPTVTDAVYDAGFGGSSRAYDGVSGRLGMKPGVWRRLGEGASIRYSITSTEFGQLLVATTSKGICTVRLGDDPESLEAEFRSDFRLAELARDEELTSIADQILVLIASNLPSPQLPVDVRATAFQQRVWDYLRSIPRGETRSYSQVAAEIGAPTATRAVARACATNPAALVVPCHRVIGSDGKLTGYRWGVERKRKLLERERQSSA